MKVARLYGVQLEAATSAVSSAFSVVSRSSSLTVHLCHVMRRSEIRNERGDAIITYGKEIRESLGLFLPLLIILRR